MFSKRVIRAGSLHHPHCAVGKKRAPLQIYLVFVYTFLSCYADVQTRKNSNYFQTMVLCKTLNLILFATPEKPPQVRNQLTGTCLKIQTAKKKQKTAKPKKPHKHHALRVIKHKLRKHGTTVKLSRSELAKLLLDFINN